MHPLSTPPDPARSAGPSTDQRPWVRSDPSGVADAAAEDGDRFGAALAVADVARDGRDDLIVGGPGEAIGSEAGAGAAWLLSGSLRHR
ncbi:FG-GAP repeat protein [Streptomyces hygroscopicus]|uniref:FG-GAP repeat protein n=1 Tax=Streptomyces hygroscopicus TaxID=1912 RepID=UPI0004CBFEEC|nr:FG-GAP repeat protein [Streptomyces hygroscopicus]